MKKLSFNTILLCLIAVCAFNLSSCQEFNIDSQAEYPLAVEIDAQAEYSVSQAQNTITFNISSNTPWKVESDKNWCIPTPAMSSVSSLVAEVSVSIEANADEQPRTATLTITADNIEGSKTVIITQASKGSLFIQGFDEAFPSEGGTLPFTITSNKPWKVISSNQWLTLDKESGEGNGEKVTIAATAKANTGLKRTATLTVVCDGKETIIDATQDGIMLEFAAITEEDVLSSNAGETKTYSVITNLASDKWISVKKNATGDGVDVTTLSEIYFRDRTATIKLEADKTLNLDPIELEIKQNRGEVTWEKNFFYEDGAESGVIITQGRFYIAKPYKLATFEVKLNSVELTKDAIFFQYYTSATGGPTVNCWMGDFNGDGKYNHGNDFCLRYRDNWGDNGDQNSANKLDLDVDKLNAMKTLKFSLIPNPEIEGNVIISLDIDEKNYVNISSLKNPFIGKGSSYPGNYPFFGFMTSKASGTLNIASFEVTPIAFE